MMSATELLIVAFAIAAGDCIYQLFRRANKKKGS